MSVFQSAYDTTACAGYKISKQVDGVLEALTRNSLEVTPEHDVVFVDGRGISNELIPAFEHPLVVSYEGKKLVASDVRATGKYDPLQSKFAIRNPGDYRAIAIRTYLQEAWTEEGPMAFSSIGRLPLGVFGTWIGEAIAKRLALEPDEQLSISIFASVMYLHLFKDGDDRPESKMLVTRQIAQALNLKDQMVLEHVEAHPTINNVIELCDACKEYTSSTRMRDLNPAVLYGVVGGFWYGPNSRQLVAVALEHPPTWITILYLALTERGYNKSGLTKILERTVFRKQSDLFLRQVQSITTMPDKL